MKRRSRLLSIGLPGLGLVFLVIGTKLVIENRPVTPLEYPPRQPASAPVEEATSFVGAIGISEPPGENIQIATHISGVVTDVLVRPGQKVARDELLFRVDARRQRSSLEQRRAQLTVAEAEVARLRGLVAVRQAELKSAEASLAAASKTVDAAFADLENKRNLLANVTTLRDERAVARELRDSRRFAVQGATAVWEGRKAELVQLAARVQESEAGLAQLASADGASDGPEVEVALRRVEQARRELESSEVELALLEVRAPIAGIVLKVNLRAGEYATAADAAEGLIVLAPEGPMRLRVEIDEVDIARASPRARAWASPRGEASRRFAIELDHVEPLVVPKRRLGGRSSELVDTRVLPLIYRFAADAKLENYGRQFDVYIEVLDATQD